MEEQSHYKRHHYPKSIISRCVWLYYNFMLSFRDIVLIMFERGIVVSYEAIRYWCKKFGRCYANATKRKKKYSHNKYHLDELCIVMNGQKYWLWRAVDENGDELDILLQSRRDKKAATKFFRKLFKTTKIIPRVMVTDKLKSYAAAKEILGLDKLDHRQHKGLNNRAENSHQPTRQKEKQMRGFKSPKHAQTMLAIFGPVKSLFAGFRCKLSAQDYRVRLQHAFYQWDEITLHNDCA